MLKNKKKLAITSSLVLFLCVGTLIGGNMIVDNVKADEDLAKTETVTIIDKDTGQKEVVKAESKEAEEAKSDTDVKVNENKSSKDTSNKTSNNNSNKNDSNKKNDSKPAKKDEATKPAKKDEGTKSENEPKPSHTHSWTAVYKEVDNGYYETVTTKKYHSICNCCGADITGNTVDHIEMHMIAGEEPASYKSVAKYTETKKWVPKIEKVVDYYKCSCGATK